MTLVSVIIPVYNRQEQLKNAINSVLAQTYKKFEVIVVDDGSSIPVSSYIQSENRIKVIRHKSNRGAASARNTGIKNSRGDLIAFLDSDDIWYPKKLEKQVDVFNKKKYIDLCFCSYKLINISSNGNKKIKAYTPKESKDKDWFKYFLLGCDLSPGSTMVVKKQVFFDYGVFDETYPRLEDWEWLLRVSKNQKIGIKILKKIYAIVQNYSIPPAYKVELANNKIIKRYKDDFKKYKWYGKKAFSKRYLETSQLLFIDRKRRKAINYLIKGILIYPFHRLGYYALIIKSVVKPVGRLTNKLTSR